MGEENWKMGKELNEEEEAFLHGSCIQWVETHFKEGDKIVMITTDTYEEELDIDVETLIHVCLFKNNKYHDIRGETEEFGKVMDDFYTENEVKEYLKENLKQMNSFLEIIKC